MCCPLVFEFSVGIGVFVIGLGQISFFFSLKGKIEKVPRDVRSEFSGKKYDRFMKGLVATSKTYASP